MGDTRKKTLIVAEAGVNHNGDLNMARELIAYAADAGADFVKFQTYKASNLASRSVPKARYQQRTTAASENQFDMLSRLELTLEMHHSLVDRCKECGIKFLSTAFDLDSLVFLRDKIKLETLKLGSGELTNAPLLLMASRTDMHIILSTGMGSLAEVEEALGVIAFGLMNNCNPSSRADFASVLLQPEAWLKLKERVTLLHCTTEYPADISDTNLNAMETMRLAFGLDVGYSDHSEGSAMSIAAVALGACIIEKHFTLDSSLPGPDHAASIEPKELVKLVSDIRDVEVGLGSGIKQPSAAEVRNRIVVRKSLHANRGISAGKQFLEKDLIALRPSNGPSPMSFWDYCGKLSDKNYKKGEMLDE